MKVVLIIYKYIRNENVASTNEMGCEKVEKLKFIEKKWKIKYKREYIWTLFGREIKQKRIIKVILYQLKDTYRYPYHYRFR